MKRRALVLAATHALAVVAGFALGVYFLPILAAPPSPTTAQVRDVSKGASYHGEFRRALKGSDALHWGEGRVSISPQAVSLEGRIAPGPAYRLYLVPEFVETGEDFQRLKARSLMAGDIKTFENFLVHLPAGTVLEEYRAVVVWCEAFSQFITAARYR
ncbi:DM13 domain-containing protein [Ramlibacter albus]|uniref:DM13 domain-containing protein n=1 Tax=Ramlibacter albus TaxID=2079448 RepID=A0A923MD80_9BURK|nr:DM13 domain-containing protein [Ramlibacter albus]